MKATLDVVDIPVTVKHRIGIDRVERYDFVRDFVGTVADAGCSVFIVHAQCLAARAGAPRPRFSCATSYCAPAQAGFPQLSIKHQRQT